MQAFCFWTFIILYIINCIFSICKTAIGCSKKTTLYIVCDIIGVLFGIAVPILLLWGAGFFTLA